MSNISWEAPMFVPSPKKQARVIFISLLIISAITGLGRSLLDIDKHIYIFFLIFALTLGILVYLLKKFMVEYFQFISEKINAKYSFDDKLIIINFNKETKTIKLDEKTSFFKISSEPHEPQLPEYDLLYIIKKGCLNTPIYIPKSEYQLVFNNFSSIIPFISGNEKKNKK